MSVIFLTEHLNNIENAKRENRQTVANIILEKQELFKDLVAITFNIDDRISIKAAWILEWICTHHHLNWILPHLDEFTTKISTLKFDGAIRPCAKICEHLANAFYAKHINNVQKQLKPIHIDAIVEAGFDWLITPQKIAVRAYTMNTLYLFGLQKDWIHPELKHLIETKIIHESKGTKARGKHILKLIEKHQKSGS
ncbi:adenylosuccinate lyase [Polaribacter sp. M15]